MDEQQKKNKKLLLTIVGVAIVVVALVGVTYAFFNYTRTGGANTVRTGRILFNTTEGENINLTNAFPVASGQATDSNPNVRTLNITVTGDTDYADGLEYLITAEDVHMTTLGNKEVPLRVDISVSDIATGENAGSLGTAESGDYFTNRASYKPSGNVAGVNKYKVLYTDNGSNSLNNGERLLVGYIAPNTTPGTASGVSGVIKIKVYFDGDRIAISDTYNETTPETDEYGTTTSWVRGREVFTTSEWNALSSNGVSFKIKVEANQGQWVPNPGSAPMSLSSSSGNITEGESTQVTITPNDNGTLTCHSSDTTKATCSISGTNLTIHGVSAGSATITVTQTAGSSYATASTATYTATIEPAGITINYNANGGSVSTPSKLIAMDATTYGELEVPTRTDYAFAGWYDASSGGNKIESSTTFTNGTSATTLYAHWNVPICKRVTNAAQLHTETCQRTGSSYCAGDSYTGDNITITYGNAKANGTSLVTGDAFDCKVTTNGGYTERFYYVSDRWTPGTDTSDSAFDSQIAVLIYYKNFKDGSPSDLGVAYYASASENWHGPVTAAESLPTTGYWSNISLSNTERMIYACDNGNCSNTPVLKTNNGSKQITPNPFNYEGKAARLLTVPEIKKGCTSISGKTTVASTGDLKECNFLFERTRYANTDETTYPTYGPRLETPRAAFSDSVVVADANYRNMGGSTAWSDIYGARPAIEVSKSNILY